MPLEELATRLSISTAEVEGIERRGVPDTDGNLGLFRVGKVLEAAKHPNADRLQLCRVDVGEGSRARSSAAPGTSARGRPWRSRFPARSCPAASSSSSARCAASSPDGMILAEDEVELGTDHSGIMVLPETEPGTPLADVLPLVEEVLLVESTGQPARPALDLRARARGRRALRPGAGTAPGSRPGARRRRAGRRHSRGLRGLPALRRPALPQRRDRPLADLAEDAAADGRDAPDLERRRRDELRDARARQPAARLRPGDAEGREDHRPPRAAGRDDPHARRRRAEARGDRPRDRRRRARGRARRDHGRRGRRSASPRPRSCSRRPTSSRPGSSAPPSACACAPRARTAGRRASTRTWPSRPRSSPRS